MNIETSEILRRRDMRDVFTFTIDPADAKDFDDAISFERSEGVKELGSEAGYSDIPDVRGIGCDDLVRTCDAFGS